MYPRPPAGRRARPRAFGARARGPRRCRARGRPGRSDPCPFERPPAGWSGRFLRLSRRHLHRVETGQLTARGQFFRVGPARWFARNGERKPVRRLARRQGRPIPVRLGAERLNGPLVVRVNVVVGKQQPGVGTDRGRGGHAGKVGPRRVDQNFLRGPPCSKVRLLAEIRVYWANTRVYRPLRAQRCPGPRRTPGMEDLPTEAARRRAIAWATALTAGTPMAPHAYEAALLERYAVGDLTLD